MIRAIAFALGMWLVAWAVEDQKLLDLIIKKWKARTGASDTDIGKALMLLAGGLLQ